MVKKFGEEVKISVSYSENVVSDNYKTRTFSTTLEHEYNDGNVYSDERVQEQHEKCMQITRRKVKDYIDRMKDPSVLKGGKKSQYTALKKGR